MRITFGIAEGGDDRLRSAIEAQVRREHQDELAATTDFWKKAMIEGKIKQEIRKRMKRVASPYSLWGAK